MSEETITSKTVVKDLCFAAWVVQACSRLRGVPTKAQALAMVEDYFNEDVEQPVKKAVRQKAGKLDAERAAFLAWVSDKLGHELDAKELRSYTGKFNYHMGKGNDPYEEALKVKVDKGKTGRKENVELKAWIQRQALLKGDALTDKEMDKLTHRWYRMRRSGDIQDWGNRGRWPTCSLHHYETATAIRVKLGAQWVDLALYRDSEQAKNILPNIDNWLISLRQGREPQDVMLEVGNHIITTPQ